MCNALISRETVRLKQRLKQLKVHCLQLLAKLRVDPTDWRPLHFALPICGDVETWAFQDWRQWQTGCVLCLATPHSSVTRLRSVLCYCLKSALRQHRERFRFDNSKSITIGVTLLSIERIVTASITVPIRQ